MKTLKILVTLGPSSLKKRIIKALDKEGANLFRINLSHTPINDLARNIKFIKETSNVPICIDTEGSQIRNEKMQSECIVLKNNNHIKIHKDLLVGNSKNISFKPKAIYDLLNVGDILNIDFDAAKIKVVQRNSRYKLAKIISSGRIGSNKAVDLISNYKSEQLNFITENDYNAIRIAKKYKISSFALSFARSGREVRAFRKLIGEKSFLISKIECINGLKNITSIINNSDAILIDRGDLSRQVSIESIPIFQRKIIEKANQLNRPVYVATNLLESMVKIESPTRAETNDVISSLVMGADGLVLAAETAIGKYPIQCFGMIKKLIHQYNLLISNIPFKQLILNESKNLKKEKS